jgi:hypothetical protein
VLDLGLMIASRLAGRYYMNVECVRVCDSYSGLSCVITDHIRNRAATVRSDVGGRHLWIGIPKRWPGCTASRVRASARSGLAHEHRKHYCEQDATEQP